MADLRRLFRLLDEVDVPDLRIRIEHHQGGRPPESSWRRLLVVAAALLIGIAPLILLARALLPSFRPGGMPHRGELVVSVHRPNSSKIVLVGPGGSVANVLNPSLRTQVDPAWSPDGSEIAFSGGTKRNTEDGDIYVMNADGTDLRQLTSGSRVDLSPAWSPDGTRIAFSDLSGGLFVVDVATLEVTSLTTYVFTPKAQGPDDEPTWSPDGTRIAFSRNDEEGIPSIFVMEADGSNVVRLTDPDPGLDLAPDWSPDGTQVAFARAWNQNDPTDIYVVDVDGTSLRKLTTNPATADAAPAWSPDGRRIAFTSNRDIPPGDRFNLDAMDLYVMNADGTNQTRITVDARVGYSTAHYGAPDWRPAP